ncbi:ribokinase [Epilithonimonas vandammei]|uniref:Ribokinase n=1 Tax=Epilithonimonas vandammei TaxID=2487072 RepID=A0A3G8ZGW4_9FLAO|nr:ribokinase [Epilithonimonas vandammei]AZI56468.1 ribokinase [Epilithonimonas vandammei]
MKLSNIKPNIVVVGSSSIDLVLNTSKIPTANNTVLAESLQSFLGGKGANQAIATSRLGAQTYFISRVGMDPFGQQVLRNLNDEAVNIAYVVEDEDEDTGTAYVTASNEGNAITVVPAANYNLSPTDISEAEKYLVAADLILTQLEIPMQTVEFLFKKAEILNKKIGIYAAPASRLSEEIIQYASFIVAKSTDLEIIFGEGNREDIIKHLPNKLFVRDGANSTSYFDGKEMKYFRKNPSTEAHNMGLGDAFTSGFSIALLHGNSIEDCVKFGNDVALKAADYRGSQKGLPYLEDFQN